MISGILPVDKPLGWTSHDVVGRLRRVTGQRQIGHAGTLDPLASGLLVIVLGSATRLSAYLMDAPKVYCAEVVVGATTDTDDAEAPLRERWSVEGIEREVVEQALRRFVGEIEQLPPRYAAVRHRGEKLYVLARQGVEVEPRPRPVTVHAIDLIDWSPPRLRLQVRCGPGTYIRSLARDIGVALGTGGYLHALRRIVSGSFTTRDAIRLSRLDTREAVMAALQPLDHAVPDWPAAVLREEEARIVGHGGAVPLGEAADGNVRLYGADGALLALARCRTGTAMPFRVFSGGEEADASRR